MSQTKKGSMYEALTNTAVGWIINYTANIVILPKFGFDVTYEQAFWIGCIFTVISIIRSYVMRRVFNAIKSRWNTEDVPGQQSEKLAGS